MSYLPTRPITRRLVATAAATAAACAISSAAYASTAAHTAPANVTCTAASLHVWVAVKQRSESSGSTYYPLEFTNTGATTCSMSGYPVVSAISRTGGQLGSPAGHGLLLVVPLVNLAPGATAHTTLAYHSGMVSAGGRCGSVDMATKLRVSLAGLKPATYATFGFRACSHAGPVYLTITQPIRAGAN
jgi:Protein of unknown function (DUF4232)